MDTLSLDKTQISLRVLQRRNRVRVLVDQLHVKYWTYKSVSKTVDHAFFDTQHTIIIIGFSGAIHTDVRTPFGSSYTGDQSTVVASRKHINSFLNIIIIITMQCTVPRAIYDAHSLNCSRATWQSRCNCERDFDTRPERRFPRIVSEYVSSQRVNYDCGLNYTDYTCV